MDPAVAVCSSGFRQCTDTSVCFPHETTTKRWTDQMEPCQEPDWIYWSFSGGTVLPAVAEARKICRIEKQWVPAKTMGATHKNPSNLFLHSLMGGIIVLFSWRTESISIHLIPSQHCHFNVIWSLHFARKFPDREDGMWLPRPKPLWAVIDF